MAGRGVRTWIAIAGLVAVACAGSSDEASVPPTGDEPEIRVSTDESSPVTSGEPVTSTLAPTGGNPGRGIYEFTGPSDLSPAVEGVPTRVYVPNSKSNTVDVVDPETFEIIDRFPVGFLPHHITPSWDLRTLWVLNTSGNTIIPIDPMDGTAGEPIPVEDPYNLYFTPDGSHAVVVAERLRRLDIRDPETWELVTSIHVPCVGVDHGDFTVDGSRMLLSCEFDGQLVEIDMANLEFTRAVSVGGAPIDVRLSPDGSTFLVANQERHGVHMIDAETLEERRFVSTGRGAHGVYPSRDATRAYVSNRLEGTISVLDLDSGDLIETWEIGGSPDMGGVTIDGGQLWLSGRFHGEVYVVDTRSGELIQTIRVGDQPHGLAVFPQPGRYSVGHTGNYR